ncbi:lysophospholipase [Phormidium sp. CLA17]|uniref:GDSL-type esterase/lipase family protein n=1 Tax=Leptolyngbya sp. Cla-17 TaxID=2803751 RepID=UPI001490ABA6|nr:GDSL-type esterase/lipase family protein [Leptolyngbya sp. Cla-17]MBM0740265.1 lysophospholipase [Leptolyngbya sp. Cla-17]MBM0745490.1 lysophospholipase [Leptolyngbya sp. Cla-17]
MLDSLVLASQIPDKTNTSVPKDELRTHHQAVQAEKQRLNQILLRLRSHSRPESISSTKFSSVAVPRSGSQLYSQRVAAVSTGHLYTHLPPNSFQSSWSNATQQPTYEQWRTLMKREAAIAAKATQRTGVLLGDSLSLWFPSDRLPQPQTWLNQSISGDTTHGILRRLSDFAATRPRVVYLMAGINDLKQGATDNEILWNVRQIITQLRRTQPQANLIVQSVLPTRSVIASSDRIAQLNRQLRALSTRSGAYFLDLSSQMADTNGNLRQELTTDGLHLNAKGYAAWQSILLKADGAIATR